MEQHAVPRQITSFEFKLIGFLTLKQFGYLVFFAAISFILFYIVDIPLLNIVAAVLFAVVGIVIVFVPYNDRPIDVWIRNFVRKLFSPSQYYFIKRNRVPDFLKDVFVYSSPDVVVQHIDARQKLTTYLSTKNPQLEADAQHIQKINNLILNIDTGHQTVSSDETDVNSDPPSAPHKSNTSHAEEILPSGVNTNASDNSPTPFLHGVVTNSKNVPLPQILIYIKDLSGRLVRMLKTNHHGVFATYHLLPENTYRFEIKDLGNKYFFDTMEIPVKKINSPAISIVSKEVL